MTVGLYVVCGRDPRNQRMSIHAGDCACRLAGDSFETRAEVHRPVPIDRPMVLGVQRLSPHVQHGSSNRERVFDARVAWHERRHQVTARVERWQLGSRIERVVGVEDVVGGRWFVAAGALGTQPVVSALDRVSAAARPLALRAQRELTAQTILEIAGVGIRCVVLTSGAQRHKRRLDDIAARAACTANSGLLL